MSDYIEISFLKLSQKNIFELFETENALILAILSWYVISLHRYGYRSSCCAYTQNPIIEVNLSHNCEIADV